MQAKRLRVRDGLRLRKVKSAKATPTIIAANPSTATKTALNGAAEVAELGRGSTTNGSEGGKTGDSNGVLFDWSAEPCVVDTKARSFETADAGREDHCLDDVVIESFSSVPTWPTVISTDVASAGTASAGVLPYAPSSVDVCGRALGFGLCDLTDDAACRACGRTFAPSAARYQHWRLFA